MTQPKHTPTPWHTKDGSMIYATHPNGKEYQIAETYAGWNEKGVTHKTSAPQAAFIVKAVNCHDGLVSLVEEYRDMVHEMYCDEGDKEVPCCMECIEAAKALAKAKGEA